MLQRNLGGGTAGARGVGGCLETHGQDRTLRKYVGRAMTGVVCSPPPCPSASVTHCMLERAWWAWFDGDRSLGGGGKCIMGAPPPPRQIAHRLLKSTWVDGYATLAARIYATPPAFRSYTFFWDISVIKARRILDDLIGEPFGFFYTRMQRLLTYWFNWRITWNWVILVVYEDVFISDLQCAMTRSDML
jgi:hypothetical protein